MSYRTKAFAAAALSLAALAMIAAPISSASAADMPVKVKAKPVADLPFFFVIDDRVTFSYIFRASQPGQYTVNPNGTFNNHETKQVYSFTHFDAWAYGTNFFTISMFKSDKGDQANPCIGGGATWVTATTFTPASCAGASEVYGLVRSTFGFNEIFNTKAFTMGPLHNVSFEIGADANVDNRYIDVAKRDFVAGLQFAFDLPYHGFFDVAPLAYKEINHNAFDQCGGGFAAGGVPGVSCLSDGNTNYKTTWAVETNWYMDLGFLPENIQFFSISGRAAWYGKKGNDNEPCGSGQAAVDSCGGAPSAVEFNSEPIRLTLDASKAAWGAKYSHNVDLWVAYRYWQNKFGLDHANSPTCLSGGAQNGTCTESSLYAGVTVKF